VDSSQSPLGEIGGSFAMPGEEMSGDTTSHIAIEAATQHAWHPSSKKTSVHGNFMHTLYFTRFS